MPQQQINRQRDLSDCSTIISILPVLIDDSKPGLIPSQYIIPPVTNPKEDFEILNVFRARFPVYLDENRPALVVPAPSDTVAESIVRDFKVAQPYVEAGVAEPALFWVPGFKSKETIATDLRKELQLARQLQNNWFGRLIEIADDDWNRYRMRRMISTMQRLALQILGEEREWGTVGASKMEVNQVACKFCRGPVHPEAIVCTHCTGVLDVKRATEMGFLKAPEKAAS